MKLEKIIGFYLPFKTTIVQFSPMRSGSTLLFNILQEIFPKCSIEKQHTYGWYFNHLKVVASVRSPYDCIGSLLKAKKKEVTDENVSWASNHFLKHGGNEIISVADKKNVLLLKYENFVDDYEYIYNSFEMFFDTKINSDLRDRINQKFNRDSVKKIMSTKQNDFSEWCEQNKIHGNHISSENGRVGYGKELFSEDQIKIVQDTCLTYINKFGYK